MRLLDPTPAPCWPPPPQPPCQDDDGVEGRCEGLFLRACLGCRCEGLFSRACPGDAGSSGQGPVLTFGGLWAGFWEV